MCLERHSYFKGILMYKKEKLEHVMGKKTNLVCRAILDTRDVIEGQIISNLLNNDVIKEQLSMDQKKQLSFDVKSSLIKQFNGLVDRVQKSLLIKENNLIVVTEEKKKVTPNK